MGRPQIRTETLSLDIIRRVLGLFGTIKNASRMLGLDTTVDYSVVYRALSFRPVLPEHRAKIEDAWDRWQELYLKPEVPVSADLSIGLTDMDSYPDWHPFVKGPAKVFRVEDPVRRTRATRTKR